MRRHIDVLNHAGEPELIDTLHFPHYRLSDTGLVVWESPEHYPTDFRARAGAEWACSSWGTLQPLRARVDKVHLDVSVERFRADDSLLTQFHTLCVPTCVDGTWEAQFRSSFAPDSRFQQSKYGQRRLSWRRMPPSTDQDLAEGEY